MKFTGKACHTGSSKKNGMENAACITGTLLTTECAITDIPEPKAPAAPAGDPGMMY